MENQLTLEEINSRLVGEMFGNKDLVQIGIFPTLGCIESAVNRGFLKNKKINDRTYVFHKSDILDYWTHHRDKVKVKAKHANSTITLDAGQRAQLWEILGKCRVHNPKLTMSNMLRNIVQRALTEYFQGVLNVESTEWLYKDPV